MTSPESSSNAANETALQKEWRLFRELFFRLLDVLLNRLFDLRSEKAIRRRRYLIFLFLVSGFLVNLKDFPLPIWAGYVQDILSYLFRQGSYTPNYAGNPFINFIWISLSAMANPNTLQYLPILLVSFIVARESTALYLADIFNLDAIDVRAARQFVVAVALSGSNETIRIAHGEVLEEHRSSPVFLIGGPGKVIVDIDSVALFEKPDGTPRIIGPTGEEPKGKATLDGFERLRTAFDLRDHFIELRDQMKTGNPEEETKSPAVKSRSQDGIPITATDVRFMFSVDRGANNSNDKNPYPYNPKAIESLVYKAASRVTPDLENPSTIEYSWFNNMVRLIRGRLGNFMSERKLTEYLASIGMPEYIKAKQQEKQIVKELQKLAPPTTEDKPKGKDIKRPPKFTPRYEIKNLFSQFAEEFTRKARDQGVELHWIGVGTWKTPVDIVPEKHLEAWKISRENFDKGSDKATKKLIEETTIQAMTTLIQDVPIGAYTTATKEFIDHNKAMRSILKSYQLQLIETRDFIDAKAKATQEEKTIAERIQQAISKIIKAFGHGP
ncbi:hypothetical protein FBQ81_07800 [Chloroflexi bacterium CFX6]|nr:hypothetical protein [Chloroflexi bacterium CFX6]